MSRLVYNHSEYGEFWDSIPPSRGLTIATCHLKFFQGVLYQYYKSTEPELKGAWIKISEVV